MPGRHVFLEKLALTWHELSDGAAERRRHETRISSAGEGELPVSRRHRNTRDAAAEMFKRFDAAVSGMEQSAPAADGVNLRAADVADIAEVAGGAPRTGAAQEQEDSTAQAAAVKVRAAAALAAAALAARSVTAAAAEESERLSAPKQAEDALDAMAVIDFKARLDALAAAAKARLFGK